MEAVSLYQLNEYIKRVMTLNFPDAVWIKAEISQIKESRGNYYLELIDKDPESDKIIAQAGAAIWYKNYLFIKKKLGKLAEAILSDGTEVSVKVRVDFNERYGHKLVIEDIDPSYTIGQMEIQRQATLDRLEKEGFIGLNQALVLPIVLQRIAIISSPTAAGYKDFVDQLEHNAYGYDYFTKLFPAALQGKAISSEVCQALKDISEQSDDYDCVVIIRGGGSKLDLSGFDDFEIGAKIAQCPIPVLTGIGHQIDLSVADLVAHLHLKTPTAVANYLIDRSLHFESDILNLQKAIKDITLGVLQREKMQLDYLEQFLSQQPIELLRWKKQEVETIRNEILKTSKYLVKSIQLNIENTAKMIRSLDPKEVLKRGYVMITKDDHLVSSKKDLKKNDTVLMKFKDGQKKAIIQ